jgi:hypothetical protein
VGCMTTTTGRPHSRSNARSLAPATRTASNGSSRCAESMSIVEGVIEAGVARRPDRHGHGHPQVRLLAWTWHEPDERRAPGALAAQLVRTDSGGLVRAASVVPDTRQRDERTAALVRRIIEWLDTPDTRRGRHSTSKSTPWRAPTSRTSHMIGKTETDPSRAGRLWRFPRPAALQQRHRARGAVDLDLGAVGDALGRDEDAHDARDAELAAHDDGVVHRAHVDTAGC